ncbi:unnamed protein product [Closterium sp. Naga37s-1]|nr:unnamed protein product [Closterium sp. Naga37s-1]
MPKSDTALLITAQGEDTVNLDKGGEEQRTEEWFTLRANRLTASAFEKAVGFFPGGRQQLWEEKLGLRAPFAGNDATAWGQGKEEEALREYEQLTGGHVEHRSFQWGSMGEGRQQLWEEKLGLRAPFAGNEATAWGQGKEEEALMMYERLTGGHVEHRSFQVRVCVG